KAREWLKLIERGIDPLTHEERQRQAEERQRQNTLAAVAEAFIKDKLPAERKGREVERDIRREFVSVWGRRPITDIAPRDIREVVRTKSKTAKPQARNLLGYAKRLFDWAVDQDCYGLATSPAAALIRTRSSARRFPAIVFSTRWNYLHSPVPPSTWATRT